MTRAIQRTNFHTSELLSCLTHCGLVDDSGLEEMAGEKLALWVHFADAITLSALHAGDLVKIPAMERNARLRLQQAAGRQLEAVQDDLTQSIVQSCSPVTGKPPIEWTPAELVAPHNLSVLYESYRHLYETHQRAMETGVQPLRALIRDVLAKMAPEMAKLAALDATFEHILRDREKKLLTKVPLLLKQRFEQLYKTSPQMMADYPINDHPAGWYQPQGWLRLFCREMQTMLLAEMALRLQPSVGLFEALKSSNE